MRTLILACVSGFVLSTGCSTIAAAEPATKKIVLIAGKKSHGPEGNGIHDYPWSVKLIKVMLDNSNVADRVRVEYHLDGWPREESTLDDADTIMVISDGRDGEIFEEAPHFGSEQHRAAIAKQIARGCGFLTFHFSTFAPDQFAEDILNWSGGYFDWETDGKRQWYSAIKTLDAEVQLATPDHPVLRGVKPLKMREEYYYNIRFQPDDRSLIPLWSVPAVEGRAEQGDVVAWAKERADGGRGFGTTCGHFYDNWQHAEFRKLILNALVWTAKAEVPDSGADARFYTQEEITAALSGKSGTERATVDETPIKALILTGHQYPGHLWKDTTPAIKEALLKDARIQVDVSENIEDLATEKISAYDLLVLNYCNWVKPGLSDAAKAGFTKYLHDGGGLIIIHFANGAFHFSLPKAGESDWPEYRKICRRVWDHTPNKSGHDAYGKFVVDIAKPDHPITQGMEPFETVDELYFRQQGDEPIEVLLAAKSNVTGRDEPMAFVYDYGKGRVMQTVLGHAAESLRTPGAVELLRRGAAWVAQRDQTLAISQPEKSAANSPASRLVEGKFGKALNAGAGGLAIKGHEMYRTPPLTVECWTRLADKSSYNILIAQEPKTSATHWELFTMPGTGELTAYLPGMKPDHVTSKADIVDDQWHYLAMIYEPDRVRLFVDAKLVADQPVKSENGQSVPGGLALGQLIDKAIGCRGSIDEIRLSRGVRNIQEIPKTPFSADAQTIGLWRLDEIDFQDRSPDLSPHHRSAGVSQKAKKQPSDNAFYHWSKDIVGFDWTEQDSVDNRWSQTDVGPFLASIVPMPGQPPVVKGLSIKVGTKQHPASVCYDTRTMALRSAWTGGFLKFDPARYGIIASPQMDGDVQFLSSPDAGWVAKNVKYLGLSSEISIELKMLVDEVPVSESANFVRINDSRSILQRGFSIDDQHPILKLRVGRFKKISTPRIVGMWSCVDVELADHTMTCLIPQESGAHWEISEDDLQFVIEPSNKRVHCSLFLAFGPWQDIHLESFAPSEGFMAISKNLLQEMNNGNRYRFLARAVTQGVLGTEAGPYQVDALTIPFDNTAKALMFITGHDFFSTKDLAVCTVHGDVWHISGIDSELKELRWQRIAAGLFQPLGLKIVNDEIYVLGRDRITRLTVNLNDEVDEDGYKRVNIDRYENFCDLYETSPGGHDYITCLETDPEGNFYFVHANHGVQKVSKDGKRLETVATGLRNPNGMSVSPRGEITAAPQEGEWTPASAIFLVQPGDHFGYLGPKITPQRPLGYDPPLCWIPRLTDNSSAGQAWTPDDSFGLPANSLLHFSFGQCTTLLTLRESIDNIWQGGVIPLPWKFQSGLSRGRFSPHDGHLYVSGLKGWVTSAAQDGCLQRVRYVGGKVSWPVTIQSYRNGIAYTFGCRLDKESAENPENYAVEACNYRYSQAYGSPDLRPSHPTVEGRDEWDVASATLLDDQRTVFLEIPDLSPVMQLVVKWAIASHDKQPLANSYSGSIHRLPDSSFDVPESSRKPRPGRLAKETEADLKPGLFVTIQQEVRTTRRVARLLAYANSSGVTIDPSEIDGPVEYAAEGYLKAPIRGDYRFRIEGAVPGELKINEQIVSDTTAVRLHKGYNAVQFQTTAKHSLPNFRLHWQSETFAEEPVPATVWYHDGAAPVAIHARHIEEGRELFVNRQCGNCHAANPDDRPSASRSPSLKQLHGRVSAEWITEWLLNPRQVRHTAEMPKLFDSRSPEDRQAAADVAAFLLKGDRESTSEALGGTDNDATDGALLFEELNCIACHRFTPPSESDPWNRDSLHFTAVKFSEASLSDYLQQPQRHHQFTRMPDFRLNLPEATGLARWIREQSLGRFEPRPEATTASTERGQKIFGERGCGHCHESPDQTTQPRTKRPWKSPLEMNSCCLANTPAISKSIPDFSLDDTQRTSLAAFLKSANPGLTDWSSDAGSDHLVRRLNCVACHHRDHQLSPRGEILSEESESGRSPEVLPNLTFVGEKLKVAWLKSLLAGQSVKTRPWLKSRMPAFPAYADELAHGLAAQHGYAGDQESTWQPEPDLVDLGRQLAEKTRGLDCRQCHAVAGLQPTGDDKTKIAPGIDFAETKQRLRADFYRHFVLDPPRYDVTIRMPKFAIDGKTTQAAQILDGDAAAQFEALWHFIQSLPDATAKSE